MSERVCLEGSEAVADVAYRLSELCVIYPITPSSPLGEYADQWSSAGRCNVWGTVPRIAEMQSEGGAAGALHGALQTGCLATTFTASQGLLLMIPNMYKIAGELTSAVIHVAARALACQGLSIFGDHSDVMAIRQTGFAMLCSGSVQEAHDMAAVAHAATLAGRVPFVHFFDGFRTSHEINTCLRLDDETLAALVDEEGVMAHRQRALNPEHPVIRGTAQNPDVYFQGREAGNRFYEELPKHVQGAMDRLAEKTGRRYALYEYDGDPHAERVIVLMGSASETAREAIAALRAAGEKVGVLAVRLYRPFSAERLIAALPRTVRVVAVLDRTKESGSGGEPLYLDVTAAFMEAAQSGAWPAPLPKIIGGRYGLSSKEFTPAMVKAVFETLRANAPRNHFTVGIHDDVTHSSLPVDEHFDTEDSAGVRAIFYGLGSDGTVGANKNTIKIIGEEAGLYAQGYFVYDSKKSGSQTVSHLRFGPHPIRSTYLIRTANFIGCHQFSFLFKSDILASAAEGAVLLLNTRFSPEELWPHIPQRVQAQMIQRRIRLFIIDALEVARATGMGGRINTIMQTCFFAISGVLPREDAIACIKTAIRKTYGKKGEQVVLKNFEAVDATLARLSEVPLPAVPVGDVQIPSVVSPEAPPFVREVTALIMAGRGEELPVSALPADGTWPVGTTRWEKRAVSADVAAWDPDLCIQCGHCSLVCPHGCIRCTTVPEDALTGAPSSFPSAPLNTKGTPGQRFVLHVYAEDCTGCTLCYEACPAKDRLKPSRRAIQNTPLAPILESSRLHSRFFEQLPSVPRNRVDFSSVRGVQFLEPLFEFSGACAGCGETPYVKLLTQLFGDRALIANATGCSSIYGGNLPTTPYTTNSDGHGPAWSNSLFEDNAEFGFGFRLSADKQNEQARELLTALRDDLDPSLVDAMLEAPQDSEPHIVAQRERLLRLRDLLSGLSDLRARRLEAVVGHLVRRSIWMVGGDGWAYDIGFGGLDHVLASGRDVNILVLDTEVYSNTGGQASKSTPLGAVAKYAADGKTTAKKDLALMAMAYGHVYVARIALGANMQQAVDALREAEAYPGPSLILAYSHCIAHGIDMRDGLNQQKRAVDSGHWPLLRYNPMLRHGGGQPLQLDSPAPRISLQEYTSHEVRYQILAKSHPLQSAALLERAQEDIRRRYRLYADMAGHDGPAPFFPTPGKE